jgi:TIR domain
MSEIFLSYARVDDEIPAAAGDSVGWVRYFYEYLLCELKQRVSKDLQFWRDVNDVEPDGDFAREIERALRQAVVMVAVLSPNYVKRPWCLRELGDFAKASASADAPQRAEQIFKILKNYVSEEDLPVAVRNRGRGYSFFEVDPEKNIVESYFVAGQLRDRYQQAYLDRINELAERIRSRLPKLLAATPAPPPSRFVFVAPPPSSSTVMETYRILTKQLETEGFGVLPRPGDPFPDTLTDAQKLLAEAIGRAELAIHLIGESSGKTCDGATEPMVPMQLHLSAAAMTARPGLGRPVWYTDKIPATKRDEQPAAPGDTVIDLRGGLDAARLQPLARRLGAGA